MWTFIVMKPYTMSLTIEKIHSDRQLLLDTNYTKANKLHGKNGFHIIQTDRSEEQIYDLGNAATSQSIFSRREQVAQALIYYFNLFWMQA